MHGWIDGWMDGWIDGWMDDRARPGLHNEPYTQSTISLTWLSSWSLAVLCMHASPTL